MIARTTAEIFLLYRVWLSLAMAHPFSIATSRASRVVQQKKLSYNGQLRSCVLFRSTPLRGTDEHFSWSFSIFVMMMVMTALASQVLEASERLALAGNRTTVEELLASGFTLGIFGG